MTTLTGRLLVAVPRAHDREEGDLFARSVVFVLHHGEDGAQGLVLTEPTDAAIDSVLPGWEAVASAPATVFQGGPVALDTAIGLANVPGHTDVLGATRLFGSIAVVDLDSPVPLVAPEIAGFRVFAGCCGWEAGQLDAEMDDGWWVRAEPEVGDLFDTAPQTLWKRVLLRQRMPTRLLAGFPDDPSAN